MLPFIHLGSLNLPTHAVTNFITVILFGIAIYYRTRKNFEPAALADEIDSIFNMIFGVVFGAWLAYTLPYLIMSLFGQELPPRWWLLGTHWMGYVAGGMLAGYFTARRLNKPFWKLADVYAPLLALALAVGRVGCLLVGDAQGRVTDSWIGMYLPDLSGSWAYRYPTQIVSIITNLLLAAILFGVEYQRKRDPEKLSGWRFDGLLFLLYVTLFCFQRFIFDFWRADNPTLFGPFHWTHLYCVIGIIWAGWMMRKRWMETQPPNSALAG